MFENKKTEVQGVHYSRYIVSWNNVGGDYYGEQFKRWLRMNCCTEKEIDDICEMATCGKMELEMSAKTYVQIMNKMIEKIENDEEPEVEP